VVESGASTSSSTSTSVSASTSSSIPLNAFDLIAFSSGLDLSGLFNESYNPFVDGEKFLSDMTVDKIIATIEEAAGELNVKCRRRKDCVVDLEGPKGDFIARVEINQLTEELVVVEVKIKGGESASYNKIWKKKLMPKLSGLIYDPKSQPAEEIETTNDEVEVTPAVVSTDE